MLWLSWISFYLREILVSHFSHYFKYFFFHLRFCPIILKICQKVSSQHFSLVSPISMVTNNKLIIWIHINVKGLRNNGRLTLWCMSHPISWPWDTSISQEIWSMVATKISASPCPVVLMPNLLHSYTYKMVLNLSLD